MSEVWTLWAMDSFDREAPPSQEGSGTELVAGLEALWRKTLAEGVDDRGNATFTWFTLHLPARRIALVNAPFDNLALARVRAWRAEPGLIEALARAHALRPTRESLAVLHDAIVGASSASTLTRQLENL